MHSAKVSHTIDEAHIDKVGDDGEVNLVGEVCRLRQQAELALSGQLSTRRDQVKDLLLCQRSCRPSDRDDKAVGHFACRAKRRRLLKTVEGFRAMTKEMGTKMISQTKPKAEFAANDATHWDVSEQRGSARIAPCLVGVGLALKKVESSCNHNSCMARSAGQNRDP